MSRNAKDDMLGSIGALPQMDALPVAAEPGYVTRNPLLPNQMEVELRAVLKNEKESFAPPLLSEDLLSSIRVDELLSQPREIDELDQTNTSAAQPAIAEEVDEETLKYLDDPKSLFSNVSQMPWHEKGKFNTEANFIEEFNKDFIESNSNTSAVYTSLGYLLFPISGIKKLVKWCQGVTEAGNFSIAKIGTGYKAYKQGYHTLAGFNTKWLETNQPFDLEPVSGQQFLTVRRLTPYHTMLLVPSSHLGVARIAIKSDDQKRFPGDQGDMVLFQQGKYLLRETEYTDISTVQYDPSKFVIPIGRFVQILNIPQGFIGGVRSIKDNKFIVVTPGKACVLDKKEYANAGYINLNSQQPLLYTTKEEQGDDFIQVLNLLEGHAASCKKLSGESYMIDKPGQYILQSSDWNLSMTEVVDVKQTEQLVETMLFYVVTLNPDEFGVCQNITNGTFHMIDSGRHTLNKGIWKKPSVFSVHRDEVKTEAFTVVNVAPDVLVGAFSRQGEWVNFSETHSGKRILLRAADFESPTQVARQTTDLVTFGPYLYTNIIGNVFVMLLENGKIIEGKSGPMMIPSKTTTLLECLPKSSQISTLPKITFKTSDQFGMQIDAQIVYAVKDPVATTEFIRSQLGDNGHPVMSAVEDHITGNQARDNSVRNENAQRFRKSVESSRFKTVHSTLERVSRSSLEKRLSFMSSSELTTNSDNACSNDEILSNVENIQQLILEELRSFCDLNHLGVLMQEVRLLGSFYYSSSAIEQSRTKREEAKMKAKTLESEKMMLQRQAEAEAILRIETANAESQVHVIEKQAEQRAQIIALEMRLAEQENQNRIAEANQLAQDRIAKIKQERNAEELRAHADAEAHSIKVLADARAEGDRLANETATARPVELAIQEYLKINATAVEAVAKAGNLYPAEFKAMLGLVGNSGGGGGGGATSTAGGGGGGDSTSGATGQLLQFTMLTQLMNQFAAQKDQLNAIKDSATSNAAAAAEE